MTINSGNPLSTITLTSHMRASLPQDARPQLQNPYDAIALFSHACMISVGFRLIGLGEEHKIGELHLPPSHPPAHLQAHNPAEAVSDPTNPQPLPTEWNAHRPNYAFRYAHTQSAMQYVLKLSRLGDKAVIFGIGLGHDKTASFDVAVADYVSPSAFPFPKSSQSSTPSREGTTDSRQDDETTHALQSLFISVGRITDLASLFKLSVLQKLAPGIQKEGYEETSSTSTSAGESQQRRQPRPPDRAPQGPHYDPIRDDRFPPPARPHPFDDPLAAGPRRPFPAGDFPPPGFEDEYEIGRPPRGGMGSLGRHPLNIGENDLYPPGLGPHDPLRPSFGPAGGLPRPGAGGGGMHPTFDDPLFGGVGGGGGGAGWDSR